MCLAVVCVEAGFLNSGHIYMSIIYVINTATIMTVVNFFNHCLSVPKAYAVNGECSARGKCDYRISFIPVKSVMV